MASQTEPFQPLQPLSLEPSMALEAAVDPAAAVDVANGDGAVAEVHGVNGGSSAGIRIDADLKAPELYLNRELTWLAFNRRVFREVEDEKNPLLERVKFLAITASNLDEFFMKRIGGLKQQIGAGMHQRAVDGRTPEQQVVECYAEIRRLEQQQQQLLLKLVELLRSHDIELCLYDGLTNSEQIKLREYYIK